MLLACAIGSVAASAQEPAESQPQPFVFCYENTELYPSFVGDSSITPQVLPGVSIDLVKMIGNRVGLKTQFVRFPWKRCLALLKSGRADGVIASYSEKRLVLGQYPMLGGKADKARRITAGGYYLYQLAGKQTVWDGKSFSVSGVTIGAPLGYSIVDVLRSQGLRVIEAGSPEGLLTMLRRERVDAVAAPGLGTDTLIKRNLDRFGGIQRSEVPLQVKAYYLMLSHQFVAAMPLKAEEIWTAAAALREKATELLQEQY